MSETSSVPNSFPVDTLNEIGVLKRREIEARIIGPFVDALANEFERERVLEIRCLPFRNPLATGARAMRWRLRSWSKTRSDMILM